jgi:hypothetical protein
MLYQRGIIGKSPFEKGETGGFEGDFDAGMVWTYSTNFSDTTLACHFEQSEKSFPRFFIHVGELKLHEILLRKSFDSAHQGP